MFDTCKTKECLEEVIKKEPRNADAHWLLGQKLQSEENYMQAMQQFDIVLKLDKSYNAGYAYRDRANCKNNLRDDSGAVEDMDKAIFYNPTERYFRCSRGVYLSNLQKYDLALNDFNKALEIWSKYYEARVWKARTLVMLKRYEEALEEYKTLNFSDEFINDPGNAFHIYCQGLAKFNLNDKDGACSDWNRIKDYSEAEKMIETNCK